MSKIPRERLKELRELSYRLPEYTETMYAKEKVKGNDVNLKGYNTNLSKVKRDGDYTAVKDKGRQIDAERHFKRLRNAYKIAGDVGVIEYIQKFSKTDRKMFSLWGLIKFYIFGIKPKGYLKRK